jgi:hypothetical protein
LFTFFLGINRFKAGEKTKTLCIPIFQDSVPEPDEVFFVRLHDPHGVDIDDQLGVARITIIDEDGPPGLIEFAIQKTSADPAQPSVTLKVMRLWLLI